MATRPVGKAPGARRAGILGCTTTAGQPISSDDEFERTSATTVREGHEYVRELAGLYDLAIVAEEVTRLLEDEGREVLDGRDQSALDQARSNAQAIVASLDRLR